MAQLAGNVREQVNVVASPNYETVFWEEDNLGYNWKTDQWTRQPAWADATYYQHPTQSHLVGLAVFSGTAVDMQSGSSGVAQTATIATAAQDLNPGGIAFVRGVRPRTNGGTNTVRVGVQDEWAGTVTYSTSTSPHARTGFADFRSDGRYVRAELTIAGGFTSASGLDIDFTGSGRV